MLTVQKLSFVRGRNIIFSNISFQIQSGDMVWLMGDNGAGKTTLLKILLGYLQPTQGKVLWHDNSLDTDYQSTCFYLGHGGIAQNDMTLTTYLTFIKNLWQKNEAKLANKNLQDEESLIKSLELDKHLSKKIKDLSAGTQKKIQLASMIYAAPRKSMWLLDEPFAALDKKTKAWLWQWLAARINNGDQIIFTSHETDHQAMINPTLHKKIKEIRL